MKKIPTLPSETAVQQRYASAALKTEPALCCPVAYDPQYLKVIPAEVIEKDYGCGDPSRYLHPGETVLDLGSGTGKICFIAAQVVGPAGQVIGIDMTDEMLGIARRNAPLVAAQLGYANVEFRKGRIQDLGLNLELLDQQLQQQPITDAASFLAVDEGVEGLRQRSPLVADESVDVVVSNCVLNLVEPKAKRKLFAEIFRVLRPGGRAVISDIVADEAIPEELRNDPQLWSGCISGAFTEEEFIQAFVEAGFHGIELVDHHEEPWQTVAGIEFRSLTVRAYRGKEGPALEHNQAVIYRGPFREVVDDNNLRYERGRRCAVSEKTFQLCQNEPYRNHFAFVLPHHPVTAEEADPFDDAGMRPRHPRETKGRDYVATTAPNQCCRGGAC